MVGEASCVIAKSHFFIRERDRFTVKGAREGIKKV